MATWQPTRAVSLRIAALVLAGGVAAGLAGCSTDSKIEVTKTNLANTIKGKLTEQLHGQAPDQVKCKDALEGKVGATQVCAVKSDGQWYTVNVTATSIDGKEVNFNYKVDSQPTTAPTY
jgi:hypothetical protein